MPRAERAVVGLTDTWGRANRKHEDRPCQQCGGVFRPKAATSAYCSVSCARKKNGGHNRKEATWWIDAKGYKAGRVWIDGKAVHKKFHRYVMEQHLGRPLSPDEDVHHRDDNKLNNEISNLEVLSHRDHAVLSNVGRVSTAKGRLLNLSQEERVARSERMRLRHAANRQARAALASAVSHD